MDSWYKQLLIRKHINCSLYGGFHQDTNSNCCSPGRVFAITEGGRLQISVVHVTDASYLGGTNSWGVVVLLTGAAAVAVMVPVGSMVMAMGARVPVVVSAGRCL